MNCKRYDVQLSIENVEWDVVFMFFVMLNDTIRKNMRFLLTKLRQILQQKRHFIEEQNFITLIFVLKQILYITLNVIKCTKNSNLQNEHYLLLLQGHKTCQN